MLQLIEKHHPDMVLPVGCNSVQALDAIGTRLPGRAHCCLPPAEALEGTLDKRKTLAAAARLGIPVPADYTEVIRCLASRDRDPRLLGALPFPAFLKAAREAGRNIYEQVDSPAAFWPAYDRLQREVEYGDVLVQECVDGDVHTYACGLLFIEGAVALTFAHEEMRSVPRRGGSGTRLRLYQDPKLEAMSIALLRELGWNGVALVEYKKRRDGTLVLMEVNAKFWASYALASRHGYRFASTMVARTLGLPLARQARRLARGEMVFPLREIAFCLRNRSSESLVRSMAAMLWPPARWDLDMSDPATWLPEGALRKLGDVLT